MTYADWKRTAIEFTLQYCSGNVIKACNILDVAPKTIYNVLGTERVREIRDGSWQEKQES